MLQGRCYRLPNSTGDLDSSQLWIICSAIACKCCCIASFEGRSSTFIDVEPRWRQKKWLLRVAHALCTQPTRLYGCGLEKQMPGMVWLSLCRKQVPCHILVLLLGGSTCAGAFFRDNCISTALRKLAVQKQAAPASLWAGLWWIEAQSQVRFSQCMHPLRRQLVLLLPSAWERECILSAEQHSCSLHHVTAIQKAFSETFRSKWRRGWPLSWMDENGMFSFPIGFEPSKY